MEYPVYYVIIQLFSQFTMIFDKHVLYLKEIINYIFCSPATRGGATEEA